MDIASTSSNLAQASQFSIQAKVNSDGGNINSGLLANLDSLGAMIGAASRTIGSATNSCNREGDAPEVDGGKCASDAITATSYVATASASIAQAVKDCVDSQTHDPAGLARCVTDVAYTIATYAKTTNEIIWATADCSKDAVMNTHCGSDIATAINAVAAAASAAARIAEFAVAKDWGTTSVKFQSLGDALMSLGQKIGGAISQCVADPPAAGATFDPPPVIGSVPVNGGHPPTTATHVAGVSAFQKWGIEGKKWLQGQSREKSGVQDTLGSYMVPAAAGAMCLVLLSIVAVSVRAMTRRPARASAQAVQAQEDTELLDQLSTVES